MPTIRTHPDDVAWTPWTEVFRDAALYEGLPIIEAKVLSDRRSAGPVLRICCGSAHPKAS